jgi:hypothetical protein
MSNPPCSVRLRKDASGESYSLLATGVIVVGGELAAVVVSDEDNVRSRGVPTATDRYSGSGAVREADPPLPVLGYAIGIAVPFVPS